MLSSDTFYSNLAFSRSRRLVVYQILPDTKGKAKGESKDVVELAKLRGNVNEHERQLLHRLVLSRRVWCMQRGSVSY